MSSLENCNIIKCYEYFSKKDKLCIIMEYADDGISSLFNEFSFIFSSLFLSIYQGDLEQLVKESRRNSSAISEKTVEFFISFIKKK